MLILTAVGLSSIADLCQCMSLFGLSLGIMRCTFVNDFGYKPTRRNSYLNNCSPYIVLVYYPFVSLFVLLDYIFVGFDMFLFYWCLIFCIRKRWLSLACRSCRL